MQGPVTKICLLLLILGVISVWGQDRTSSYTPTNGTTYEEVVVETSLSVRRKPATALRRQQLSLKEKGVPRTRREISHSASHLESKLKSNAVNPVVGHQKHSQDHTGDFLQSFFDKGFNNGASKAEQQAFYKQKPATTKKDGNRLV